MSQESCEIKLFCPPAPLSVRLCRLEEGESVLMVPDVSAPEEGEIFYNKNQALSRDMSLLFYKAAGVDVLDGMTASGARAVRLAKNGVNVVANDYSGEAVKLVKKNAELNGVNFEVINKDIRQLLHERRFGAVDIDPFGSPAPFIHCALSSAVHYLGVASTDTAALTGTYPRVSRRRYGFVAKKLPNYPEIGVRALAGFVVREAAKLEISATPVFAHAFQHYYRVYFKLKRGAGRADKMLDSLGDYEGVGPIYLGNLWDKKIVGSMKRLRVVFGHKLTEKHIDLIVREADFPRPYHDFHDICRRLKIAPPPLGKVLEAVKGVRTHFAPQGFRSNAENVEKIVGDL